MGSSNLLQDQNVFENVLESSKVIGIFGMSVQTVAYTGNTPFYQFRLKVLFFSKLQNFHAEVYLMTAKSQFLKQKAFVKVKY